MDIYQESLYSSHKLEAVGEKEELDIIQSAFYRTPTLILQKYPRTDSIEIYLRNFSVLIEMNYTMCLFSKWLVCFNGMSLEHFMIFIETVANVWLL